MTDFAEWNICNHFRRRLLSYGKNYVSEIENFDSHIENLRACRLEATNQARYAHAHRLTNTGHYTRTIIIYTYIRPEYAQHITTDAFCICANFSYQTIQNTLAINTTRVKAPPQITNRKTRKNLGYYASHRNNKIMTLF